MGVIELLCGVFLMLISVASAFIFAPHARRSDEPTLEWLWTLMFLSGLLLSVVSLGRVIWIIDPSLAIAVFAIFISIGIISYTSWLEEKNRRRINKILERRRREQEAALENAIKKAREARLQ